MMGRIPLSLLLTLTLCALCGSLASAAAPVVEYVSICPGRDSPAPGYTTSKYQRNIWVLVSDADGAGDIASVTITDPSGSEHTITPTGGGAYWVHKDDYSVSLGWCLRHQFVPLATGCYTITATDTGGNPGTLVTPPVPEVSDVHPEPLTPQMDSVIYETAPTFEFGTAGLPCADYWVGLEEEGTLGWIWSADLGERCEPIVQVPYPGELQPNRSYFWRIRSFYPVDDGVSDPRVAIWALHRTIARFTVYGDWPEVPPNLPGKIAYETAFNWWEHPWCMGYDNDPNTRWWLGPDLALNPDWSPDGTKLMYRRREGGIWIDSLDGTAPIPIPGLVGAPLGGRWAPDGNRICFSEGWFSEGPDVFVVDTDGSNLRVIASDCGMEPWPAWSPDGQWIAYGRAGAGLRLIRPGGTDDHAVSATAVAGYPDYWNISMAQPAWSPDAQTLAVYFSATEPGGDPNAWPYGHINGIGTVSPEGGTLTPVFVAPAGVICCAMPMLPYWSPDGTQIVFRSAHHVPDPAEWDFEPRVELFLANADGTGDPVRLTYDYTAAGFASWWASNTEPGPDVSVTKGDTTVTFATVTGTGSTTVCVTDEPPAPTPSGFQFLGDYYDISTTAETSGVITIEIHYDDADVPGGQEEWLSLLHWEVDHWVDITVRPIDTVNNVITGECTSLSEFGIAFGPQFHGLLQPVNNDGSSIFKLNRTVPLKFQLVAPDGSYVSDAVAKLYVAKVTDDVVGTYEEPESTSAADTGNAFRYDADANQYILNLGTKGLSEGTWALKVTVNGMVAKEVWISLR